jgi:hypothetical protein
MPPTYPAPSLNQFSQTPVVGQMDLRFNPGVVSCILDSTSAGNLLPGQPVKVVDGYGGTPHVVECAANSDDVFGFIAYSIKDQVFNAGMKLEIAAMRDNVMYMQASAAIARNAQVAIVIGLTDPLVVTATAGMTIVGRAYDKALAAGSVIRVQIDLPGTTHA